MPLICFVNNFFKNSSGNTDIPSYMEPEYPPYAANSGEETEFQILPNYYSNRFPQAFMSEVLPAISVANKSMPFTVYASNTVHNGGNIWILRHVSNEKGTEITSDNPIFVDYYFKNLQTVSAYSFKCDDSRIISYNLKGKIQNSDSWTVIHSVEDFENTTGTVSVTLPSSVEYRYFRLEFTKLLSGGIPQTALSLYAINFYGVPSERIPYLLDKIDYSNYINITGSSINDITNLNNVDPSTPVTLNLDSEIFISFKSKISVNSYTIRNNFNEYAKQLPSGWTLFGSNDQTIWTEINTQADIDFKNTVLRNFNLNNAVTYQYFKFKVNSLNLVNGALWHFQLNRFKCVDEVEYYLPTKEYDFTSLTSTDFWTGNVFSGYPVNSNTYYLVSNKYAGIPKTLYIDDFSLYYSGSRNTAIPFFLGQNAAFSIGDIKQGYSNYVYFNTQWGEILDRVEFDNNDYTKGQHPSSVKIGYRNFELEEWQTVTIPVQWTEFHGVAQLNTKLHYRQYSFNFLDDSVEVVSLSNFQLFTTSVFALPLKHDEPIQDGSLYKLIYSDVTIQSKNSLLPKISSHPNITLAASSNIEEQTVEFKFTEIQHIVGFGFGILPYNGLNTNWPMYLNIYARKDENSEWILVYKTNSYNPYNDGQDYTDQGDGVYRAVYFKERVLAKHFKLEIPSEYVGIQLGMFNLLRWHLDYLTPQAELPNTTKNLNSIIGEPITPPLIRLASNYWTDTSVYGYYFDWNHSDSYTTTDEYGKTGSYIGANCFAWSYPSGYSENASSGYYWGNSVANQESYLDTLFVNNQQFDGFTIAFVGTPSTSWVIKQFQILESNDKQSWTPIMSLDNIDWAKQPTTDNVYKFLFPTQVKTRYLRFKCTSATNRFAITSLIYYGVPTELLTANMTNTTNNRGIVLSNWNLSNIQESYQYAALSNNTTYHYIDYANMQYIDKKPVKLEFKTVQGEATFVKVWETNEAIETPDGNATLICAQSVTNTTGERVGVYLYNVTKNRLIFQVWGSQETPNVYINSMQLYRNDPVTPWEISSPILEDNPY